MAQGRVYYIPFAGVSISAAQDLFSILPADDKPCIVHGFQMSNTGGTADAGDAQEELLQLEMRRGFTSQGSGGTAPTPPPCAPADAAAGFTAHVNDTTPASGGTGTLLWSDGWNIRIPYSYFFTPETRPAVTQGQTTLVLLLKNAPADAVTCSGVMFVEEIG